MIIYASYALVTSLVAARCRYDIVGRSLRVLLSAAVAQPAARWKKLRHHALASRAKARTAAMPVYDNDIVIHNGSMPAPLIERGCDNVMQAREEANEPEPVKEASECVTGVRCATTASYPTNFNFKNIIIL